MPQSACMSAFHSAWVSDHGGEGNGRGEGELANVKGRKGEGRKVGVRGRAEAVTVMAAPAGVTMASEQAAGGAGGR